MRDTDAILRKPTGVDVAIFIFFITVLFHAVVAYAQVQRHEEDIQTIKKDVKHIIHMLEHQ